MGTPYAYTNMFDIAPLQEALNATASTIMSNQTAFGVQSLYVQRGADITQESLQGGMNIIEGNSKPEPINFTATAKETFDMLNIINGLGEQLSGINSVTRGQPEASLRSGNALALVQSMSIQFQNGFQRNYIKFLENIGSALVEILKDFSTTPKMIAIVGKNKRPFLKEFTGDMISDIRRVRVDVGNPLARTTAGRLEIANNLLQQKMVKNQQEYFTILETGRVDMLYEGDMQQNLLIKRENEWLMEGKPVLADPLDSHRLHITEHLAVISDPDLRMNPELSKAVRDHIQEHIDMLRTVNPDLLMIMGEQPLNPVQQAGAPSLPAGPMNPGGGQNMSTAAAQSTTGQVLDPAQLGPQATPENLAQDNLTVPAAVLPNPSLDPRAQ
jgi:hypothetical protein